MKWNVFIIAEAKLGRISPLLHLASELFCYIKQVSAVC